MRTIAKYEILGLLGRGGWATVYKARLPQVGRIVALKVLDPRPPLVALLGRAEIERRFLAEARAMAGLSHPHLAQVWDYGQAADGRPYYSMEYFCRNLGAALGEGFDLEQPTRRLPAPRALAYADQTLAALGRLHWAGLVHRDVTPYNLLLDEADQVKLADFGLSRRRGERRPLPANLHQGTPFYSAPEQEADPEAVDQRADLYSAAVLLWRMLTGGLDLDAARAGQAGGLGPGLGESEARFWRQALALRPEERFGDAAAMRAALAGLAAAWRAEREALCQAGPRPYSAPPFPPAPAGRLRDVPRKATPAQAEAVFGLDRLWRPAVASRAVFAPAGQGEVADRAHGLVWQAAGSPYALTWAEAQAHLARLNQAGAAPAPAPAWRLPTLAELISLVRPADDPAAWCAPLVFDPCQRWLWSADRRSALAGWGLDLELGCACVRDYTCRLYVRAVRPAAGGGKTPITEGGMA
ncbi:MAG: protein kinase [Pseudomonadota bacterium]